ncbi:hypothetical protein HQQ82_16130 [Rathayibacter sp. VKM Ac-2856]|uniref:hypothetical protein n=1 Tax=unclassified Rathayibacter TaxID=2609250 RepID=UPI001563E386|nr:MULTISPECIES: hypothetical protein [unclassified Rathayibacter]NQX06339.1 hypothetical protein [Rathayibacter sp. VKM Ac-2858]NQX21506.1 hypothetical protein [Rathayibacter sp. VKM Ac-2856]
MSKTPLLLTASAAGVVLALAAGTPASADEQVPGLAPSSESSLSDVLAEDVGLVLEGEWSSLAVEGDVELPSDPAGSVVAGGASTDVAALIDAAALPAPF